MDNTTETQFYGPNLGYVLELYELYREDPESVDESTRSFFENWSPPKSGGANGQASAAASASEVDFEKVVGATKFIRHVRDFGHTAAQLDPLGSEPTGDPTLDPAFYRISEEDLETLPADVMVGGPVGERAETAKEAVDELRRIYCKTTGYDFGHIREPEERFWLREAVESERFGGRMENEDAKRLLERL
ncbi:MAG TPA: 2-oxoglutarate dehydrogenase E1 component, partial [Rubrobacteraceae bacterium]|nr:2-oxoglutarate dehydrogenase E1 component [Rubrobacteraceae bacterium]